MADANVQRLIEAAQQNPLLVKLNQEMQSLASIPEALTFMSVMLGALALHTPPEEWEHSLTVARTLVKHAGDKPNC